MAGQTTYFESDGKSVNVTLTATVAAGQVIYVDGFLGIAAAAGDSGDVIALNIDQREYQFTFPAALDPSKGDIVYIDAAQVTNMVPDDAGWAISPAGLTNPIALCKCTENSASDIGAGLLLPFGNPRDGVGVGGATFTINAEAADTITVNVQLTDAAGADMAVRTQVPFYLSDNANGDTVVAAATSLVAGTDGVMIEAVSNSAGWLVSEADGDVDVVVGDVGVNTYYLVVVMPSGNLVVSGAITFA